MPAFEAPVYTLKGIKIRFGSKQLFEDVELYINRGDKFRWSDATVPANRRC